MRENALKSLMSGDRPALNGWLCLPASFSAEIMAGQGWDSLTIDLQHGLIDYQVAVGMLQAISSGRATPLVRVPWLDPAIIMKVLDAGAYGVICPLINSAEETERFVAACHYPPAGIRSFGPLRASVYGGANYFQEANRTILAIAMIETQSALEHLDEILSVPGLDGIYVGPADLSIALGFEPTLDSKEETVNRAIKQIVEAARAKNLFAGIHTNSAAYARRVIELGYRFVTIGSDVRFLTEKSSEILRGMERSPEGTVRPGPY
jgi:4-hydroxy-2-oxoheptanedioate aldolase